MTSAFLLALLYPSITIFGNIAFNYTVFTKKKTHWATHVWVWSLAYLFIIAGYITLNFFGIKDYLYYYCFSVVNLFALRYLFQESLPQNLFVFFASWGLSSFVASLGKWGMAWLPLGDWVHFVGLTYYISFYLLLILITRRYWASNFRQILRLLEKGNPLYAVIPFIAFVLFVALFGPMSPTNSPRWFLLMLLFESLVIFVYYLLFSHFQTVYARLQAEDHLKNTERQLRLQKRYYEEVDRGTKEQARLIHDARHHLVALASLTESGNLDAIHHYVDHLLENYEPAPVKRYCAHSIANAVIGGYIDIALKEGLTVSVAIDLPEAVGIDEYELCTLFGNTIENAIEACQRIPEGTELPKGRYIDIKARTEAGQLVYRIENSAHSALKSEERNWISSKGAKGGVGLESVRRVIESHQGCLSLTNQNSTVVLSAVLCLESNAAAPKQVS